MIEIPDGAAVVVHILCSDPYAVVMPGSKVIHCQECASRVWSAPSTDVFAEKCDKQVFHLCLKCAKKRIDPRSHGGDLGYIKADGDSHSLTPEEWEEFTDGSSGPSGSAWGSN